MLKFNCIRYSEALREMSEQMEDAAWRLMVLERDISLGDMTNIEEYRELSMLLFGTVRQDRRYRPA